MYLMVIHVIAIAGPDICSAFPMDLIVPFPLVRQATEPTNLLVRCLSHIFGEVHADPFAS